MKELNKAVNIELRKECREEALKILVLTDDKYRKQFMEYHMKDQGTICCLVLDFAKKKLIEAKKWVYNSEDCFNNLFDDELK